MKGYTGKIARVDLSSSSYESKKLDENIARKYLGGRGLGTKILYDELHAGIDPFSPENIIVFATGPLTGTKTPSSGRHFVISKSPATGGITFTSSGGTWAAEMKKAGYDAIIVKGKAKKPTYLWIKEGNVELRDASSFWGKFVSELADISIGCGSPEGWSTVVLRTEKGEELFSELEIGGTISTSSISSIELEHLKETSEKKRKRTKTKTVS